MQSILWAATGTGFTFLMTTLGAAMVFLFRKQLNASIQRIFLGFAAGVMIAASVWSLLIPAMEEAEASGLPYMLPGMEIKGHEFHYWDCECRDEEYRMTARKPAGGRSWRCMRTRGNVMAGFPHLYYPSCPGFAARFADRCIVFGRKMGHES